MRMPATTPRRLRPLALASALLLAPLALAQQGQPIEQQMTPEQFRAAGLDRLSAGELASLNAWLNRTLDVETTRAAETAKQQVAEEQRGFPGLGSSDEPVNARLTGAFNGFGKGREYRLDNGQVWRQSDGASLAGVKLDQPTVTIAPSLIGSAWYLKVEGYNTRAKVERVK